MAKATDFTNSNQQYADLLESLDISSGAQKTNTTSSSVASARSYVMGMPPHFTPVVDPYARVFAENMLAEHPIISILPGRPNFRGIKALANNTGTNESEAAAALTLALGKLDEMQGSALIDAIADPRKNEFDKRYYSFEPDMVTYKKYAQALLTNVLAKMRTPNMNWYQKWFPNFNNYVRPKDTDTSNGSADNPNSFFVNLLNKTAITFWIDKSSSYTDDYNNDYGPSMLDGLTKTASDMMKEVNFLLGAGAKGDDSFLTKSIGMATEGVSNILTVGLAQDFSKGLGTGLQTIANGARILYPEIWKDSTYTRSVNLSMKFEAPYGTPEAIYEYIFVPLISCLTLTLPRQHQLAGYYQPFLVQVDAPGWFNINLGAVTNCSIQRAPDSDWSIHGYPMSLIVNLTIKDLYPTLMMSSSQVQIKTNPALHSYLDNLAGVQLTNVADVTKARIRELLGTVADSVNIIAAKDRFIDSIRNKFVGFFDKLL